VSYKEFRALVLHPNPGVVDLLKEVNKAHDADILQEKQALAGKRQGMDLNSFHRQKEMTQREQKKKMIAQFVIDNEVNFEYIKQVISLFSSLYTYDSPSDRIRRTWTLLNCRKKNVLEVALSFRSSVKCFASNP